MSQCVCYLVFPKEDEQATTDTVDGPLQKIEKTFEQLVHENESHESIIKDKEDRIKMARLYSNEERIKEEKKKEGKKEEVDGEEVEKERKGSKESKRSEGEEEGEFENVKINEEDSEQGLKTNSIQHSEEVNSRGGWRHGNELGLRCHLCNRILFSQFVTTLHDSLLILNEKLVNSQNMCLLVEVEKDEEIDGYKRKIEKLQEQMKVREYDNFILAQKLIKEVELRSQLMVENDLINQELNLLTEQLFNEANSMVSNEARKRSEAEALRQQAMSKLEETKNQLMYEQLQLAELREKIEKYAAEEEDESHLYDSGSSISSPVFSTSTENSNSNHLTEPIPDDKKFTRRLSTPQLVFDARLYVEFEDFIQDLKKPNSKLNSLYFMKRCIEEDIEPCLKYVGRINFKRFLDAFSENRCYVELIPKKDKNLYDSQVCCACDYKRLCTYQYKLKEEDSWKPIDRFCRDRMVAIADFYSLIRNIKLGLMRAVPLHDLYHEFSRLRRQIFYARIGSLHLFPATTKYFSGVLTNPNFGNEELITLKRSFDEDGEFKNSREFQIFENEESRRLSQISSLKNLFSAEFEAGSSGSEEDARRSNQITFPPKEPPQDKEDNYRNSISSAMKAFRSKQNSMIFKKSPKDLTAFEKSLQPGQSSSSLKDLKD